MKRVDEKEYEQVMIHLSRWLDQTPYLTSVDRQEASMVVGDHLALDLDRLCSGVGEVIRQRFDGRALTVRLDQFDPALIAARIAAELLPTRFQSMAHPGRLVSLEMIAKLIARDLGIPRSALQQSTVPVREWVRW